MGFTFNVKTIHFERIWTNIVIQSLSKEYEPKNGQCILIGGAIPFEGILEFQKDMEIIIFAERVLQSKASK